MIIPKTAIGAETAVARRIAHPVARCSMAEQVSPQPSGKDCNVIETSLRRYAPSYMYTCWSYGAGHLEQALNHILQLCPLLDWGSEWENGTKVHMACRFLALSKRVRPLLFRAGS